MYGNTFSNKKQTFGGGYPIWSKMFEMAHGGGNIQDLPTGMDFVYPSGSAVEITEDGMAKILGFYEVQAASSSTTVKVMKGLSYIKPIKGRFLMVASDTDIEAKSKGVTILKVEDGDGFYTLTLSEALGSLAKGAVLQDASAAGASVAPYAVPDGLLKHDIYIDPYTFDATAGAVIRGTISKKKMPTHPMSLEKKLTLITFDKRF